MRTTITVDTELLTKLNKLKYKFGCETLPEVIERLLKLLTKFKMHEEFENLK